MVWAWVSAVTSVMFPLRQRSNKDRPGVGRGVRPAVTRGALRTRDVARSWFPGPATGHVLSCAARPLRFVVTKQSDEGAGTVVVRVGVVGAGIMGADHARQLARFVSGAEVVLLADPDLQRARAAAEAV